MPMLSNLNFDPRNIRLPELPMPKLPGMQGDIGIQPTFKQPGIGITPPTLKTNPLPNIGTGAMPFLPETRQPEQNTTGFVIQRKKDGSIDWFNTLAQAGALAATAIGAAKGNVALAAAGSGYLQGTAQGLEQRANRQERQSVRDEAAAERDFDRQEKADTQQRNTEANVREWIARGDYSLAEQSMKNLPPETQAELKQVLETEKKRVNAEKVTKNKDALTKTVDGFIYNSNTVQEAEAALQYAQNSQLSEPEKSRKIAEANSRIEKLFKADQTEKHESVVTAAKRAINSANSPEDLDTVMALEMNNPSITEAERKDLLSAIKVKKVGIQRNEYLAIAKSLAPSDPEASARYYGLAGYPITADELRGKFLYREQNIYNRYLTNYRRDNPNATMKQAEAYANEMFENVYDKKYDPNAPEKSVEDKAGGQSAVTEVAKQQWVKGNFGTISEGKVSLDQVLRELDASVEKEEYLPNADTALQFKMALLDSLIANPSVPSITKKEARKKKALLIP